MGMFGKLTSLLGGADTAEHTVKKVVDGVYNGVDKLFYTDEEKSDARQKAWDSVLSFITMAYADQNSTRSVTRRWLAWAIVGSILLSFFVSLVLILLDKPEKAKAIIELANAYNLGEAFLGVIVFYFGVQFMRSRGGK